MELRGARILLTGGSLGIGRAAAKLFTEAGAKVGITARHKAQLMKTASAIGAFPIHADVAREDDIDRIYDEFLQEFGGLDVLINNAGIGIREMLDDVELPLFERIFSVNVYGPALMAKRAAQIFKAQNYGHIINVGATSSMKGFEAGSVYSASKFALRGMTECWRSELRQHNVRVMLINPSEVTSSFDSFYKQDRPEQPEKLRPQEIAHIIKAALEMDDRGFIPELQVWATNPF